MKKGQGFDKLSPNGWSWRHLIARLSGILAELTADGAVIDVAGVGYQVHRSARTLDALGPIGGEVLILTELQVREDAWTLFGFGSAGRARHASAR